MIDLRNAVASAPYAVPRSLCALILSAGILIPGSLSAQAPDVSLDDSLAVDVDHDGRVDAGDTIEYQLEVNNSTATDGDGVHIEVPLDPNLALDPGSLASTPLARKDFVGTDEDTPIGPGGNLLANDFDLPSSVSLQVVPASGSSTAGGLYEVFADGTFSYSPNNMFESLGDGDSGSDEFPYSIVDTDVQGDSSIVSVTISGVNDAPTAIDDLYTVAEGGTLAIGVGSSILLNDSDLESDPLTAQLNAGPTRATSFTLALDGSFYYEHDGSETSKGSFSYFANDGTVNSPSEGTVTIQITPVNDSPVITGQTTTPIEFDEDTDYQVKFADLMVTDPDSAYPTVFTDLTIGPGSNYTVTGANNDTIHPDANYFGSLTVPVTVSDDGPAVSNSYNLSVNVLSVNDPPTATAKSISAFGNTEHVSGPSRSTVKVGNAATTGSLTLLAGSGDGGDGPGPMSAVPRTNAATTAGGSVTILADGSFSYSPPAGATGAAADSFTYQVTDDGGTTMSSAATVTVDLSQMVWYVDSAAGAGGTGTSTDPFQDLPSAEAASSAGETISLAGGGAAYADGIALKSNQRLIGGAADLVVGGVELLAGGTRPVITFPSGPIVITLAAGTDVRGLGLQDCDGNGLFADSIGGGASIADVSIVNQVANAVHLANNPGQNFTLQQFEVAGVAGAGLFLSDTGTVSVTGPDNSIQASGGQAVVAVDTALAMTFDSLETANGIGTGILLHNVTGQFDVVNGIAITDSTARGVDINGASTFSSTIGSFTCNQTGGASDMIVLNNLSGSFQVTGSTTMTDRTERGIQITNCPSGTITFADVTMPGVSSGGGGILITNTAANVSFGPTTIPYTTSTALDLNNATGTVSLASFSAGSTSVGGRGISATGTLGNLIVSGGLIQNASADSVGFENGSGNATINCDLIQTGIQSSVEVSNWTSGTLDFGGAISDSGAGILLSSLSSANVNFTGNLSLAVTGSSTGFFAQSGGIVSVSGANNTVSSASGTAVTLDGVNIGLGGFTFHGVTTTNATGIKLTNSLGAKSFSNLNIQTTTGPGIDVSNGGEVTVTGTSNRIAATGQPAVSIANSTIGTSGITLLSAQSTNSSTNGISLNATSGGTFTVTGDGSQTQNGSGGGVTSSVSDGILLSSVGNTVILSSMNLQNCGGDAIKSTTSSSFELRGVSVTNPVGHGWEATDQYGNSVVSNSLFTGLNTASTSAIRLRNTNINGNLTLNSSSFTNQGAGNSATYVTVQSFGSSSIIFGVENNCQFTGLRGDAILSAAGEAPGSTGTVTTSIQDSDFLSAAANGSGGVAVTVAQPGATQNFTISGNTFQDLATALAAPAGIITANCAGGGGALSGTISGNTIDLNSGTRRGIQVVGQTTNTVSPVGTVSVTIDNNDIDRIPGNFAILIDLDDGVGPSMSGPGPRISNNRIGQKVGSEGQVGDIFDGAVLVRLRGVPSLSATATIENNNIRATTNGGGRILYIDVRDSRSAAVDVLGNTIRNDDPIAFDPEFYAVSRAGTPSLCLNLDNNTATDSSGTPGTGELELVESAGTFTAEDLANIAANNTGTVTVGGGIVDSGGSCIP
ncbi:tandem-95 repeat protein [bacterium]|nr:tandem-95 repeat protein [bacterium]